MHRSPRIVRSRLLRGLAMASVAIGTIALGGCDITGIIADKIGGSIPLEPAYRPDPLLPLVVIAENYRDPGGTGSDAYRIQQAVSDQLAANKVAPIIASDRVLQLRDRNPLQYRKMSVIEIARAVGASQVVYIDVTSVGIGTQIGSDTMKGAATANVKLIDVNTGTVLYPKDLDVGASVAYESLLHRGSSDVSPDRVRAEALLGLSQKVSEQFHSHFQTDMERLQSYE